jgi:hypothetical protein
MAPKKIKPVLNSEWYLAGLTYSITPPAKVGNTNDPGVGNTNGLRWGILVTLDINRMECFYCKIRLERKVD